MFELITTAEFDKWLKKLKDRKAKAAIGARLIRLRKGHFGDAKPVSGGIYEMRFHLGAGYRIYYTKYHGKIILLLCGGDKDTQERDIQKAAYFAQEWENNQ